MGWLAWGRSSLRCARPALSRVSPGPITHHFLPFPAASTLPGMIFVPPGVSGWLWQRWAGDVTGALFSAPPPLLPPAHTHTAMPQLLPPPCSCHHRSTRLAATCSTQTPSRRAAPGAPPPSQVRYQASLGRGLAGDARWPPGAAWGAIVCVREPAPPEISEPHLAHPLRRRRWGAPALGSGACVCHVSACRLAGLTEPG